MIAQKKVQHERERVNVFNRVGERVSVFHRVGQRANDKWYNNGLGDYRIRVRHQSTVSFMFFRFSDGYDTVQLWRLFRNYGWIVDIYMPKWRLRSGQRFGFVRFRGVMNVEAMERSLSKIRIGVYHLSVFQAWDRYGVQRKSMEGGAGRKPTTGVWRGSPRDDRSD